MYTKVDSCICTCSQQDPNNLCPGVHLCGEKEQVTQGELRKECSISKENGLSNLLIHGH